MPELRTQLLTLKNWIKEIVKKDPNYRRIAVNMINNDDSFDDSILQLRSMDDKSEGFRVCRVKLNTDNKTVIVRPDPKNTYFIFYNNDGNNTIHLCDGKVTRRVKQIDEIKTGRIFKKVVGYDITVEQSTPSEYCDEQGLYYLKF